MKRTLWSQAQVIAAIQKHFRHRRGLTQSRQHRHIYQQARRYFPTWEEAIRAAGLMPVKIYWTRQRVIDYLKEYYPELGQTIWEDRRIESAAINFFGGRHQALKAAGFAVIPRLEWNTERVLQAILDWKAAGKSFEKIFERHPKLYAAGQRYFGSWRQAMSMAGLAPPPPKYGNKEEVLAAIRERQQQGQPLRGIQKADPELYRASRKYCGGWIRALRTCGTSYRLKRQWTQTRLLEAVKFWDRKGSRQMWREDGSIYYVAKRRFGSWKAARQVAGLSDLPPQTRWSASEVVATIRHLNQDQKPIGRPGLVDSGLATAAKYYFGNWRNALVASGLGSHYHEPGGLSREELVQTLQVKHAQGMSLSVGENRSLIRQAIRHFGSWGNAKLAAGIPLHFEAWSREMILGALWERHRLGPWPISPKEKLYSAAKRYFGTWRNALKESRLIEKA